MADEKEQDDSGATAKSGGGVVKTLGLGVGLIVVVAVSQIGTMIVAKSMLPELIYPEWMMALAPVPEEVEEVTHAPPAPPVYTRVNPSLVVSYQTDSSVRFLQVTLEAMARDQASIEAFELHSPRIRNDLLMMFASETLEELSTREGKERARKMALDQVRKILAEESSTAKIEDLYFTSFVLQ